MQNCRSIRFTGRSVLRLVNPLEVSARPMAASVARGLLTPKCVSSVGAQRDRMPLVFTNWTIYKGKAALALKPIKPTWERSPSGNISLSREGTLLLEFAKNIEERKYDWENKVLFGLSATELTSLVHTTGKDLDFYHDPGKMTSTEGQVTKSLKVSRLPDGGSYFSLTVREKGGTQTNIQVAVSDAEMKTLRVISNFLVPRMLGFDEVFHYPPEVTPEEPTNGSSAAAAE